MSMARRLVLSCILIFILGLFTGCGKKEEVNLTVWTPVEDEDVTKEAVKNFIDYYSDDAILNVVVHNENVTGTKRALFAGQDSCADIFRVADDQVSIYLKEGFLLPVTENKDDIINRNGGKDAAIIKTITSDGNIYGYPATTSNGFFLFYDKSVLTDRDVETLDRILEVCNQNNRKFTMDWTTGWYTYSFFGGAGMSIGISEDGLHNVCDFNKTDGPYTGVDVAQAMLAIASNPAFFNCENNKVISEMKKGDIAAVVSGGWHTKDIKELWGENIGAVKLPTYTIKGDQVQMYSFAGYTYFGVNSNTSQPVWSQRLADWLTNYDTSIARLKMIGDCPANVQAANNNVVKESESLSALHDQSRFSTTQNILEDYWDPMSVLGAYLATGNADNQNLQQLLDSTVEQITQ